MKIAVLDLGTNTFHLLIASVGKDNSIKKIFKSRIAVKLGEDSVHRHWIAPAPYRRGLDALRHYAKIIREYKPDKVSAFATSAIRGASNGRKFVADVRRETGISIKVISGSKEAELICSGVRHCVPMSEEKQLIMDIGGGSTEFIIANKRKIFWKKSFDIGATRLLQLFKPGDPVKPSEIKRITDFLDSVLTPLDNAMKEFPAKTLIGSSGSFDTLADMIGWRFHRRSLLKGTCSLFFDLGQVGKLHYTLLNSTTAQRMKMKGLVKMRVDTIVLASICTQFILSRYGISEMILSKYALKEGALWQEVGKIRSNK